MSDINLTDALTTANTTAPGFPESPGGLALGVCCSVLAVVITSVHVYFHLRHLTKPEFQVLVIRILITVPVYGIGSAASLLAPDQTVIIETIRDIYESFVIYSFLSYLLALSGGENECVTRIAQSPGSIRHPWPLCRLRPIPLNSKFLRWCKKGALQFVIIKPICAVVALIMLATGNSEEAGYTVTLSVVYNISYTVALYALCTWDLPHVSRAGWV